MSTRIFILAALVLALAGAGGWYVWDQNRTKEFALLTPEEIAQSQAAGDAPLTRGLSVLKSSGPRINVFSPDGDALNSPVSFDIRLSERDGVAVNMKSIKIEYKSGVGWLNVTRRIMREARVKGTKFTASGAVLPKGRHALRLSVQDMDNRLTQAIVEFSVR